MAYPEWSTGKPCTNARSSRRSSATRTGGSAALAAVGGAVSRTAPLEAFPYSGRLHLGAAGYPAPSEPPTSGSSAVDEG